MSSQKSYVAIRFSAISRATMTSCRCCSSSSGLKRLPQPLRGSLC
jgi:hypothetical protein